MSGAPSKTGSTATKDLLRHHACTSATFGLQVWSGDTLSVLFACGLSVETAFALKPAFSRTRLLSYLRAHPSEAILDLCRNSVEDVAEEDLLDEVLKLDLEEICAHLGHRPAQRLLVHQTRSVPYLQVTKVPDPAYMQDMSTMELLERTQHRTSFKTWQKFCAKFPASTTAMKCLDCAQIVYGDCDWAQGSDGSDSETSYVTSSEEDDVDLDPDYDPHAPETSDDEVDTISCDDDSCEEEQTCEEDEMSEDKNERCDDGETSDEDEETCDDSDTSNDGEAICGDNQTTHAGSAEAYEEDEDGVIIIN